MALWAKATYLTKRVQHERSALGWPVSCPGRGVEEALLIKAAVARGDFSVRKHANGEQSVTIGQGTLRASLCRV